MSELTDTPAVSFFAQPVLPSVDDGDLARAVRLLHRRSGIVLGRHKRDMTARVLAARTQAAALASVRAYLDRLEGGCDDPEWDAFVSAFTINHTAFFREHHHFRILGDFVRRRARPVAVWCCASSTGEEAYSLAMTLLDACGPGRGGVSVLASDIDTQALAQAREGVYTEERIKPVPQPFLRQYFLKGTGRQAGMVRVKASVRDVVNFREINLVGNDWPAGQRFDAIFCRNTMIYFDRDTQQRILERFVPLLKPGGLIFVGHSENFSDLNRALRLEGQTVYSLVDSRQAGGGSR